MPVYLYFCEECGEYFEKLVPFSESDPAPECPYCQSHFTTKQITGFSTRSSTGDSSSAGYCGSSSGRFT